mmetsp:Transcript_45757/g.116242  ORF Transcript_45757/g.116242 Transcript_45757/m.116242 type:complete len:263 (+) Transcript_45757:61-849(+)
MVSSPSALVQMLPRAVAVAPSLSIGLRGQRFRVHSSTLLLRSLTLCFAAAVAWRGATSPSSAFLKAAPRSHQLLSERSSFNGLGSLQGGRGYRVVRFAAKKKANAGSAVCDGDTVYIKVHTGRYIGELDGTSRKEWVKARGTKKDALHALTIEKTGGGEIQSGDAIKLVMPLAQTNGTKIHMDIVGSAVRARFYDARGDWQKMTLIKQAGGVIRDGDQIFIRSVFKNGRDYMDANPLEKAADGEVKCRWPDEGEWQAMTIEK